MRALLLFKESGESEKYREEDELLCGCSKGNRRLEWREEVESLYGCERDRVRCSCCDSTLINAKKAILTTNCMEKDGN